MPFWKRKQNQTPGLSRSESARAPSPPVNLGRQELPDNSVSAPPRADLTYSRRGDEYFNQGNYVSAIFMYNEALMLDPNSAVLNMQLALCRTMITPPQLSEALQNINAVLQLDPGNGSAWKLKGEIHDMQNDSQSAEDALVNATGFLQGYARVQAQQSLASVRMKKLSIGSSSASPISAQSTVSQPLEMPTTTTTVRQPNVPSPPAAPNIVINNEASSQPPNPPAVSVQTTIAPTPQASPSTANAALPIPPSSPPAAAGSLSPTIPLAQPRPTTPNMHTQGEVLAQELDIPTEAPPSYTATPQIPLGPAVAGNATNAQISDLRAALTSKRQGSIYLRPYKAANQIDAVQLLHYGKTYLESILFDLPVQEAVHISWKKYFVSPISHPGTNFIDYDCESTVSYQGYHLGTTSVLGYAEEYRERQLALAPLLQLTFESQSVPPPLALDVIASRIQLLQANPTLEDNAQLEKLLGLPAAIFGTVTTKTMIEDVCMCFHRGQYDAPGRFIDFLTTASFSKHLFGTTGIGLTNFLYLILLGIELAIRMKKLGSAQTYPNVVKTTTSALVVISKQWMENVTLHRTAARKYTLGAAMHASQTQGLLQFAETISWPYMDEARQQINSLYTQLIANPANVPDYLKDWLYGLVLPGKFFRHRILSCLVLACPSTKHLDFAPYYNSGLVIGNKSYWPRRSVLGRVLGGLRNPKLTCGWIGPVPAPVGVQSSWILIHAQAVNFAIPALDDLTESNLDILGFSEDDATRDPIGITREINDLTKWNPPTNLPARQQATTTGEGAVRLSAIRLQETVVAGSVAQWHRATLDFACHGTQVSFTLYSNPLFVHVPKCEGAGHPIHDRLSKKLMASIILAKNLRSNTVVPATNKVTIIDATEPGEEAMARAWCSETARHALIRKSGIGCFACATNLATKRVGLGFNVLIWC